MDDLADSIRRAVARDDYLITHHARQRRGQRGVTYREVVQTILHGEVIESHPQATPHPKCLFMYPVREDEPLYVSCGFDGRRAYIITIHWYDPTRWLDWRTRR